MNLINVHCHWKNCVDWITAGQEKMSQSQKCTSCEKVKQWKTFSLLTTFYNFALKIETHWAKMVVKPILKLVMPMMLLCMFDFFILSLKISKNIQCKK